MLFPDTIFILFVTNNVLWIKSWTQTHCPNFYGAEAYVSHNIDINILNWIYTFSFTVIRIGDQAFDKTCAEILKCWKWSVEMMLSWTIYLC